MSNWTLRHAISTETSKLPIYGHLQYSRHAIQDAANAPLIACLQQLSDLRRVAFTIDPRLNDLELCSLQIISTLQDFAQKHCLHGCNILKRTTGCGYIPG